MNQDTVFRWNPRRKQAVTLLARGDQTDAAVAAQLGVTVQAMWKWQRVPEFVAAVESETERLRNALRAEGIANKQNRIDALNHRHRLMEQVIAARAEANRRRITVITAGGDEIDFEGYAAAGAETGLMVHTVTYLRDGRREEWAVDAGLLKELREHEKQAAIEVSQWTERRELTGDPDKPLQVKHAGDVDFDRYTALLADVLGLGPRRLPSGASDGAAESVDPTHAD